MKVGAGAGLTVTTAAAEKVYRSLAPETEIAVKLEVGQGGKLAWLPQETIVFDQVRLRRSIDVDLAQGANLLLAEASHLWPLRHGRNGAPRQARRIAGA